MTEPIISPWIIYGFFTYEKFIKVFGWALAIIVLAFLVFTWVFVMSYTDNSFRDDAKEGVRKQYKRFTILTALMVTLNVFLPSKEVLLSMIVAQNVTPQRVEQTFKFTGETIDGAVNYVGNKSEKAIERTTEILTDNVIKVIKAAQDKE